MKTLILFFVFLFLLLNSQNVHAQKKVKKGEQFPTYEQIRGNRHETYDYVAPRALVNSNSGQEWDKPNLQRISRFYNAFEYPDDSTTYYLNGGKVKNRKIAEAKLKEEAANVDRVMIGAVDEKGMRIIEIDYEPKKK
jgi:hypothetical protein